MGNVGCERSSTPHGWRTAIQHEMSTERLQRLVSSEQDRHPALGWEKLASANGRFCGATGNPSASHLPGRHARSIAPTAHQVPPLYSEQGLDLVMIDYLQLMNSGTGLSENRVQEISFISRNLKQLARELNVPVLAAAQLSRAVEQRQDKHPQLSDLRESGSIEQDSDVVMFIYRDEVYDENTERPNQADIIVAKHRNGPTGVVALYFRKELTQFSNLRKTEVDFTGY
jgi:hypothetical protein